MAFAWAGWGSRSLIALVACAATAIIAAVVPKPASAQLVDNGTSMIDSATNLEWLDLTETEGLSWNQANATDFVTVDGYTHATIAQVTTLFLNAGFPSVPATNDPANDPAAAVLLGALGCTDACGAGVNQRGRGFALAADGTSTVRPDYHNTGLGAGAAGASLASANLDLIDATAGHFLVRSADTADAFTIVVFGDTQTYTQDNTLLPVLGRMVDWVIANVDALDIELVVHVGDVIQSGTANFATATTTAQWAKFDAEWRRMDGVVPYAMVRGNHDNADEFLLHYGPTHFGQLDLSMQPLFPHYVGTHPGEDDDASAWLVNLGGQDTIVLGVSCNPSSAELDWMQDRLDENEQNPAIVVSHMMTWPTGVHFGSITLEPACSGNGPVSVWEELVEPYANQVFMTASGHVTTDVGYKRIVGIQGERVLETFQNWQGPGRSALGCLSVVHVRPGVEEVEVESHCTELNGGAGGQRVIEGVTSLATASMHFQIRDSDADGVLDTLDNCPRVANPGQEDDDLDEIGNACELVALNLVLPGDQLLTLDTNTGLVWLDLSESLGLSFDQVEAELLPGGTLDGFRFANQSEVIELWGDAGIPDIDVAATSANVAPIAWLLSLVGTTIGGLGAEAYYDDATPNPLVGTALLDSDGVTALAVAQDDVRDLSTPDPAVASWLIFTQPLPTPQDPGTVTYDLAFSASGGSDVPVGMLTIDAASVIPGVQVSFDELGGVSFSFSDGDAVWDNADLGVGSPLAFVSFDEFGAIVGINLTVTDSDTSRQLVLVSDGSWSSQPGTGSSNFGSYGLAFSQGAAPPPAPPLRKIDLLDPGDALLTLDDVTRIEWLHLYLTQGLSYAQAENTAYVTDLGFRHATEDEVATFLTHAGFVALDNLANHQQDFAASILLQYMGCTQFCGTQNELGRGFADLDPTFATRPFYRESPLGGAAVTLSLLTADRDLVDASAGHFLVRDPPLYAHVPISPLARFAIAACLTLAGAWQAGRPRRAR